MAYQVDCLTSPNLSCCGLLALGRTLQARAAVHVKHVEDQAVQVKAGKINRRARVQREGKEFEKVLVKVLGHIYNSIQLSP